MDSLPLQVRAKSLYMTTHEPLH